MPCTQLNQHVQVGSPLHVVMSGQQLALAHVKHAVSPGAGMHVTPDPVLVPVAGPPVDVPVAGPPVLVPVALVLGPPVVATVFVPVAEVPAPPCDDVFVIVLPHEAPTAISPTKETKPRPSSRVRM